MWFLPSRGRPKLCQEALEACADAGMSSPGIVYVDGRVDTYPKLRVPDNWKKVVGGLDLAPSKTWFHKKFPNEKFYGILFDDLLPKTAYFDTIMEEEAGDWYLVDTNDLWFSRLPMAATLAGAYGWGGKLVKAVGWWSFPGIRQAGNDDAWCEICCGVHPRLRKHLREVIVEHRNWRTGKRRKDETDNWVRDGIQYIKVDFAVFKRWRHAGGAREALQRVVDAMAEEGFKLSEQK